MNKDQNNLFRRLVSVDAVGDKNQLKMVTKPKLQSKFGDIKTVVAAVRAKAQIQTDAVTGKVVERDADFEEAVDETMAAVGALFLYYEDQKDESMMAYASVPETYFSHGPRETSVTNMLDVVEKIRPLVPELGDYDYYQADFEDLQTKTNKIRLSQSETYSSLALQKAATQTLPELLDEGSTILKSLGRHMKIMAKHDPEFAREFWAANEVKDLGIRHEEEETQPQPETNTTAAPVA